MGLHSHTVRRCAVTYWDQANPVNAHPPIQSAAALQFLLSALSEVWFNVST